MSSNVAAVCASFKSEMMQGIHDLATGADVIKAALYYQNSSLGSATTAYSATGEVSGTGYTAGGQTVTNGVSPTYSGLTAYWTPSGELQWTSLTIASDFDACLLYNSSKSNRAICVLTFPAQTVAAGTFTITWPSNTTTAALFQVS